VLLTPLLSPLVEIDPLLCRHELVSAALENLRRTPGQRGIAHGAVAAACRRYAERRSGEDAQIVLDRSVRPATVDMVVHRDARTDFAPRWPMKREAPRRFPIVGRERRRRIDHRIPSGRHDEAEMSADRDHRRGFRRHLHGICAARWRFRPRRGEDGGSGQKHCHKSMPPCAD